MIEYRSFRNDDPPALVKIWTGSRQWRGVAQRITTDLIDDLVLAKPYFDRDGLIVALKENRPVGFAHAGFGPSADLSELNHQRGVVSMVMVLSDYEQTEVPRRLLERAEQYLIDAGAQQIIAMGIGPMCPFYLGLYGGSDLPGILESDAFRTELFRGAQYEQMDKVAVFQRQLAGFRPKTDRKTIQVGRATNVQITFDPAPQCWWDACTKSCFDQAHFQLVTRDGGKPTAYATFWNMETIACGWNLQAMGLGRIEVQPDLRREGRATYLLGESLRQLYGQGINCIECQVMQDDEAAVGLMKKLGFEQIDTGTVYSKSVGS